MLLKHGAKDNMDHGLGLGQETNYTDHRPYIFTSCAWKWNNNDCNKILVSSKKKWNHETVVT